MTGEGEPQGIALTAFVDKPSQRVDDGPSGRVPPPDAVYAGGFIGKNDAVLRSKPELGGEQVVDVGDVPHAAPQRGAGAAVVDTDQQGALPPGGAEGGRHDLRGVGWRAGGERIRAVLRGVRG